MHPPDGEPLAGPWVTVTTAQLAAELVTGGADHAGPRVVAVDGRGGSGKSTLADSLLPLLGRAAVVHTDDIAWHHAFFDWAGLLAEHVLLPLRRGDAVEYRPEAWGARGRPGAITVPQDTEVVLVEGTGVVRQELADLVDSTVWIQVDQHVADRRLAERDGVDPAQLRHMAEWDCEERPFLAREQPWAAADLVVAGSPLPRPCPPGHLWVSRRASRSTSTER